MDQEENGRKQTALQEYAVDTASAAMGAASGLLALHPNTCYLGLAVATVAPYVVRKAGQVVAMAQAFRAGRGEERVYEAAQDVNTRLEAEGLGDRKESLKDFWTEAIPVLEQ